MNKSNQTLYIGDDTISQDCCIGTREEWKINLADAFKQWHSEKLQKEEIPADLALSEWIEQTLDDHLSIADEDEISDSDYQRLKS